MDLDLEQLAIAIADAKQKGLTVELSTPAISTGGYEEIVSFEPAGDGFASVKAAGMSWMEYLVPANTIQGVRIFEDITEG